MQVVKKYGVDFFVDEINTTAPILVLNFREVMENFQEHEDDKIYSKTHTDGWTISARVKEDRSDLARTLR